MAWAARRPGPTPDTQVLLGFRELECWAAKLSDPPLGAKQPHPKIKLSACSKLGKLLGSLLSKPLIPSPGYISALLLAHGARRLEAGRNPKHLARNRQPVPAGPSAAL